MGWLDEFRADPLGMLSRTREYGNISRFRAGPAYIHVINHPDAIKRVLLDNHRTYSKDTRAIGNIKAFSGENIFTGEGDFWLKRRRLMQPAFHRQQIASFGTIMHDAAQELVRRWSAQTQQTLRIDEEMMRVTLQIVGRALFSIDLTHETRTLGDAFADVTAYVLYRVQHPFYPPLRFPTRRNRRALAAHNTVTTVIQRIIRERVASGEDKGDLLSLLMAMRDKETGQGLDREELGREIVTMIFAGHETTANTLTWAWFLLSQNPAAESKLHAELDAVLQGRAPTMDDVPNLVYTRRVIDETLRVYPPAWAFGRKSLQPDTLGEYDFPAKSIVIISPYTMHRHPKFWNHPEAFDPDRFAPEQSENRPRYAYLPFGGGPRLCIGQPFALAEATLLLSALAQRYQLRLAPNRLVTPEPHVTLGVAGGLPMTVTAR